MGIKRIVDFANAVENEGLDYAINHYDNWDDLEGELGKLVKAYQKAAKELEEFLES